MGIVRIILALSVVIEHLAINVPGLKFITGPTAVQSFFVISGFYMALVLNTKYQGPGSTRLFLKNRLLRIYPTYYLIVVLALAMGLAFHATGHAPVTWMAWGTGQPPLDGWGRLYMGTIHLTLVGQETPLLFHTDAAGHLHGAADALRHPNAIWPYLIVPPAWSLSLELIFYAIAPFLVRRRPVIMIGVIAASLTVRALMTYGLKLDYDPWFYRFFPSELSSFMFGALAWRIYNDRVKTMDLARYKPWILAACWGFWIAAPYVGVRPAWTLYFMALMAPFLFAASRSSRKDRAIGELSYPIYICHWPVLKLLESQNYFGLTGVARLGFCVTVVMAVAWCIYRFFEQPIEAIRSRIAEQAANRDRERSTQPA